MIVALTKRVSTGVLFAFLFFAGPWVVEQFWGSYQRLSLSLQPAEAFFLYHDIKPSKTAFTVGEPIKFISYSEVYQPLEEIMWNDRLRCATLESAGQYFLVGAHIDATQAVPVRLFDNTKPPNPWQYNGAKPEMPGTCYLESIITVNVGHGVIKTQRFIGDTFNIK